MNVETHEKIRALKREADELYPLAQTVAREKGVRIPKKHGAVYRFQDAVLSISWDSYHPNLSVYAVHRYGNQNEWVLNFTSGDCTRFRKGPWVKHLTTLAEPLLAKEEREKQAEAERLEHQMLEAWGLEE